MRHGSKLTYEELQKEARQLLKASDYTQGQMAKELGVTRTSIAKAVTTAGPKFQRLQMKIIETLTDYTVERRQEVYFRTWRTDRGAGD